MPARKSRRTPQYKPHASGQAYCRIDGKFHYLGKYGSPESRGRYKAVLDEWRARQGGEVRWLVTINELCLKFDEWAEAEYRRDDGTPTGEYRNLRDAVRHLVRLHGRTRVCEFGPLKLKQVRQAMVDAGMVRTNINRQVDRVRRVFSWGVENELVPAEVLHALREVAGLRAGRKHGAKESEPVGPVSQADVAGTLPHLPATVRAMVQLQLLTGARPGEICNLRPCDVEKLAGATDGLWLYKPAQHKTKHRGKERRIYIGPQGQAVLRAFLEGRALEAPCFSPAESEALRSEERRASRRSPMTPSQAARQRQPRRGRPPREHYTKDSYNRAIARACGKAGLPAWSPNQLRHSRATILRERYGIEAAQVVLGHSDAKTTEIYAERDFAMAARIMAEVG